MIPNKFLCYLTEEAFKEDLSKNLIQNTSIVVILREGIIYTHGTYFYCNFSPEIEKVISTSITNLNQALEESGKAISQALNDIKSKMLEKKDFNLEEINANLENKKQEIINDVNTAREQINRDLLNFREENDEIMSELVSNVNESLEGITEIERVSAHSLGELDKKISDTNATVSLAINELKSQISELTNKINTDDQEL